MRKAFTAFVAILGLAAQVASAQPPEQANTPSLDGTWQVALTYYYEGTTTGFSDNLQYLQQFGKDGRTVIYLPQQPGQRFEESRTACAGEWKRRGGRTFDVTLYCTWAEMWTGAPSVPDRILVKVTLAPDGKSWTAVPFYYQPFVDGEYSAGDGWGDMKAWRLGLVPIQ